MSAYAYTILHRTRRVCWLCQLLYQSIACRRAVGRPHTLAHTMGTPGRTKQALRARSMAMALR